ncbi:histidine phosphatase family protein [Nocardioides marmoriginsengisoli]|uniref:Histidine phosphatase family protein n=1 Tax=Nocardioides marmoriginsengisoli TaxID=661483 RepID=A0A3N0CBB3_9ACTN|nr:histidine phosphatase family protein [Nocardioides marmoriginsengisoli]RNL60732.1 histidine phosphatase family protein [Nocardioides marmoriginsengisoli]
MSDLMCAATLVVARHGDAAYVESRFSDEGGSLTAEGRSQARALADLVSSRRVAHVWTSDTSRAVQTAEIVAARLSLGVTVTPALREVDIGGLRGQEFSIDAIHAVTDRWFEGDLEARFAGGESGAEVVGRYRAVLEQIVDQHRGETVLVVSHQTAGGIALPSLAQNVTPSYAEHHLLENGASAELVADNDTWHLTRWGDRQLG